jgi:hypothetical protein
VIPEVGYGQSRDARIQAWGTAKFIGSGHPAAPDADSSGGMGWWHSTDMRLQLSADFGTRAAQIATCTASSLAGTLPSGPASSAVDADPTRQQLRLYMPWGHFPTTFGTADAIPGLFVVPPLCRAA